MKKILHLICNSHIDPVWQWDWDEGASATLATFYSACNLLDKYDFVFCHNEVLVYEYIERYDPVLFARIKDLIKQGKWKVMGGWYCQPDCLVPSGESFIRQITLGREYFSEKFGVKPRIALNFDSFGHTKGLVQILKKTGYEGYIFCRPDKRYVSLPNFKDYPHGPFLWKGYDGSKIKALRYEDYYANYTTPYGKAREFIEQKEDQYKYLDIVPVLWGVGNHGGNSSEKDLEDIIALQKDKAGEWELIHSTLEDYFDSINPTVVDDRQIFVFSKAYSSIHAIKRAHDDLENALYSSEKICTAAELKGKKPYNKEVFKNAERVLCKIEFHDVLAGTAVKSGTQSSVRKCSKAIDELKQEMFASFYSMMEDLPPVTPGDDNIVLFNQHPYEYDGYIEAEFYPMQLLPDEFTEYELHFYDLNHKPVEYQLIKEESNIRMQHRVRVIFKAKMPAFGITSIGCHVEFKKLEKKVIDQSKALVYRDEFKEIKISKETGLIESYVVNGHEYAADGLCGLYSFNDNADPWGWRLCDLTKATFNENGWPQPKYKNTLKPFKLDNSKKGPFDGLDAIRVVEDGKFLTEVQALFKFNTSYAVMNYKIYKNSPYIDVNVHLLWNESHRGVKLCLPLNTEGKYFTQMAFGHEVYKNDGIEQPGNRYVASKFNDDCFALYNRSGIHSYSKKGNKLFATLSNGAAYCAHPTRETICLTEPGRFVEYADQGANDFSFRISVNKENECERISQEFNEPVYETIAFPHGTMKKESETIKLTNKNIVISCLKRSNDGKFIVRLYNGSKNSSETDLIIKDVVTHISLKKYSFETFLFDGRKLTKVKDSSIY